MDILTKLLLALIMITSSFLLGIIVGNTLQINKLHIEAIQHNVAHYDATTGQFKWNDEIIPNVQLPQSH